MSESPLDRPRSPLSIQRLTAAFAQMLGGGTDNGLSEAAQPAAGGLGTEISPKAIIEAILFVGADNGRPRTTEELAAAMRDVTPEEVQSAVLQLNNEYDRDGAPYHIAVRAEGFRLQLREDFERLHTKFHGREKEARLSAKALEVLSVVAYRQPTTSGVIDELRGAPSGAVLSQLVRRGLIRRESSGRNAKDARYCTTPRFLQFFRLDNVDQLPRAAELEE